MRLRLLTLTSTVLAIALTIAAPVAASTPPVAFTDNGFVPSSVVLDAIRLNVGASLDIHNGSTQNVVFCEQASGTCSFTTVGQDSGWEFDAADTTMITTPQFPNAHLMVGVPMQLEAASRAGITVRWTSHALPDPSAPSRFDVQWRKVASGTHPRWQDFAVQTTSVEGTFAPPHPGHYAFRSRLCDTFGGLVFCSLWSPELEVRI
jgi:hypothetical protein